MLIYRIISILNVLIPESSISSDSDYSGKSAAIKRLLDYYCSKKCSSNNAAFISLNWDIVLENYIRKYLGRDINYDVECEPYYERRRNDSGKGIKIAKVQGQQLGLL